MTINNKFEIEQIVFLKTDHERLERIVTRISITGNGALLYDVCQADKISSHYEFEMEAVNGTLKQKMGYGYGKY